MAVAGLLCMHAPILIQSLDGIQSQHAVLHIRSSLLRHVLFGSRIFEAPAWAQACTAMYLRDIVHQQGVEGTSVHGVHCLLAMSTFGVVECHGVSSEAAVWSNTVVVACSSWHIPERALCIVVLDPTSGGRACGGQARSPAVLKSWLECSQVGLTS
jgi:hypothetical protein